MWRLTQIAKKTYINKKQKKHLLSLGQIQSFTKKENVFLNHLAQLKKKPKL